VTVVDEIFAIFTSVGVRNIVILRCVCLSVCLSFCLSVRSRIS